MAAPVVEISALDFIWPGGIRALEGVSFSVQEGERVAIVGPSGAGKSTLLKHVNGLLPHPPEKVAGNGAADRPAAVSVCELPVVAANLPEVRRLVGFLFQDPDDQLFCPTVREDVAFGPLNLKLPKAEIESRIAESLEAVGLSGYEGRSTLQLSVGERKRVCLAGILACQPRILVLDEPSSNLDPRARRSLLTWLQSCGVAQIIATHDLDLVLDHCQRVIVLDDGKVQDEGPPGKLLADAELMQRHGLEVPWRLQK